MFFSSSLSAKRIKTRKPTRFWSVSQCLFIFKKGSVFSRNSLAVLVFRKCYPNKNKQYFSGDCGLEKTLSAKVSIYSNRKVHVGCSKNKQQCPYSWQLNNMPPSATERSLITFGQQWRFMAQRNTNK